MEKVKLEISLLPHQHLKKEGTYDNITLKTKGRYKKICKWS